MLALCLNDWHRSQAVMATVGGVQYTKEAPIQVSPRKAQVVV